MMTEFRRIMTGALACALLATAATADTVGVSRCDREVDGVFRAGLLTVEADGTRTFHPVGENGLTETIVFNEAQALAWVEAQGLFPEGTRFGDYANVICGLPCEECPPDQDPGRGDPEVDEQEEEEVDPPDPQ